MTKNEAKQNGQIAGAAQVALMSRAGLLTITPETTVDEIKQRAALLANEQMIEGTRVARDAWYEAFFNAFVAAARRLREELPEVKAAYRARRVTRHLDSEIERAHALLVTFTENLAKNAQYAFNNSDRAMQAAATLDVYLQLQTILVHETGGIDVAITEARDRAMRYARFGYHSTSAVSNLMAEFEARAYAEFAEHCDVKE